MTAKPVNEKSLSYCKNFLKETKPDHVTSNKLRYKINDKKLMNVNASG